MTLAEFIDGAVLAKSVVIGSAHKLCHGRTLLSETPGVDEGIRTLIALTENQISYSI